MGDHKNQHFVPRCYLRQFSGDNGGKALCLLHIGSGRFVRNASVKDQCARPFLYGDDLALERVFQEIEGEYARAFRNVSTRSRAPKDEDLEMLREFMILQSLRTEAMILKVKRSLLESQDVINAEYPGSAPELDPSTYHMMLMTMSMYAKMRENLIDLKVCLVRNKTRIPFITCDDPVAFSSMFHAEKLHTDRFGFGSTGAVFFLPLSSKLLLLCYDGDAYIVGGKSRNSISLSRDKDVRACNELQYLKAVDAIYFSDWEHRCELNRDFNAIRADRRGFKPEIGRFVPDGYTMEGERHRRLEEDEKGTSDRMLFALSFPQVLPSTWISPLRLRKNIRSYYDGSAAGYVRLHVRSVDLER